MNTPKLTVLMPVYNCEPYLREAIDSILHQTFSDFEFLIINDASTDGSEEIILSYTDPRIKYVKNDINLRLVGTLNRGLDLISTPYMVRMDGDDVSTPERLHKLFTFMESHPEIGVCGSFIETFGNDNTVWEYEETDDFIRPSVFYKSMIGHASAIFRVSVLNENKVFYSERHIHMEDKVLWFSLLNITKFHNIQEVLYKYRILDHNITIINKSTLEERVAKYYYEVFTHFGIDFTPSILKIHMGYSNFSEFSRLELVHYFQWLNILIEKARLEKFSSHASLKYHLHLMSTRMVQKAISGKNTSILLVTLQNHSWIEKVPIFFRFALNRTKIYLRAIIRKKAIR